MTISRRNLLQLAGASGLYVIGHENAVGDDRVFKHGNSLFGDLKYPPDFKHFDYVNPNAPKGGKLRLAAVGSFDSLNPYILKGEAAAGLDYIIETLTTQSLDEVGGEYGLIASSMYHPEDKSSVTYKLRPEARWHDGAPVTEDDVIFGFTFLKETNPRYQAYYKNVVKVEKTGDHEVTFSFDVKNNRELPGIMGQAMVIPKHYWEGADASGVKRNISETTLIAPLGSGPYRIKDFKSGQQITYERVKDYWGKDLPVNIGINNFDEITIIYFRDRTVIFEAFKADQVDVRTGAGTKEWDIQFDFPAVKKGLVVKKTFFTKNIQRMQGYVLNTRKPKFADARVRRAFLLAFDWEGQMRTQSFGDYNKRLQSYFQNSELQATGLPQGQELAILEEVRGQVPPEVFTTEYVNPVNGSPQNIRKNLRLALDLLKEAGWTLTGSKLVNAKGERMTAEFLLDDPSFEDNILYYKPNLERLGIEVIIRSVDPSQYQNRVIDFDFDIVTDVVAQSLSPGNEQREYWGSEAAGKRGSQNLIGIKNPAVDKLVDRVIFAKDRAELVAATRALDRVLLWNYYMISQFYRAEIWLPHWDRFGHPEKNPDYSPGFPTLWWWDEEKAKKVAAAK